MTTVLIVVVTMEGRYMVSEIVEQKLQYINRHKAIQLIRDEIFSKPVSALEKGYLDGLDKAISILSNDILLPTNNSLFQVTLPPKDKYEYHYDHTDCIYYSSNERHTCPSTCAQYRDGWNDAMQYIFRGGDGYRPYRRNERYEE